MQRRAHRAGVDMGRLRQHVKAQRYGPMCRSGVKVLVALASPAAPPWPRGVPAKPPQVNVPFGTKVPFTSLFRAWLPGKLHKR